MPITLDRSECLKSLHARRQRLSLFGAPAPSHAARPAARGFALRIWASNERSTVSLTSNPNRTTFRTSLYLEHAGTEKTKLFTEITLRLKRDEKSL